METLKQEIKKLAELQKVLKDQRKTVHSKLERTIDPERAKWEHISNREYLRLLYAAQGLLRGKTFNQIESHFPEENHPLKSYQKLIDEIVKKHEDEKIVHISE